jgi:serine/threonine-protein kinase HipA
MQPKQVSEIRELKTVEHSLIRLKSGELAYITTRIDRENGIKLYMGDMCQITERITEHKHKGSYEQIARAIKMHTANPGLNVADYFGLVLFSFLTGNNDMHIKNFSLLKRNSDYDL